MRSGPRLTKEEIDFWLPADMQNERTIEFIQQCIMNMHDRAKEEDYLSPRVLREAALWLEQNQDAENFFLTVESFDPHEPWLVPAHYRRMYLKEEGPEQVKSGYADTSKMDPYILRRTQANYSGSVTQCDRWFGYFMESMRVLGLLDNTMVVFTTDHGHSIGDKNYMGKRGYPSAPEVYDVPLMIRFPGAEHAGKKTDMRQSEKPAHQGCGDGCRNQKSKAEQECKDIEIYFGGIFQYQQIDREPQQKCQCNRPAIAKSIRGRAGDENAPQTEQTKKGQNVSGGFKRDTEIR